MYSYCLYGLKLASEIPLDPLEQIEDGQVNALPISIRWGEVPETLSQLPLKKGICYQAAEDEFILKHKDIGVGIYIKNSSEIVVDRNNNKDTDTTVLYLLGSVIGAVLMMKDFLPIHGSSVLTDKGAVIFTGVSGAGKSTIAGALLKRGYKVLTDDICPIKVEDNIPYAYPGHSNLKLWESSLNIFKEDCQSLSRVRGEINKYYYNHDTSHSCEKYPVCKIYKIESHNEDKTEIIPVENGINKLTLIQNNTYRKQFIEGLKKRRMHFKIASALATLPVSRIKRPNITENFDAFVDEVEKEMDN